MRDVKIAAWLLTVMLVVSTLPVAVFGAANTTCAASGIKHTFSAVSLTDNDTIFEGYVNKMLYPEENLALYGTSARETLCSMSKKLYDFLKEKIEAVAAGDLESTTFVIDAATLEAWGAKITWDSITIAAEDISDENKIANYINTLFWEQFEMDAVFTALLHDCPYELYWFDKTTGIWEGSYVGWIPPIFDESTITNIEINDPYISFFVAVDYQPTAYDYYNPTADTAKTGAVTNTVDAAKAIVEKYAELSDYEKLCAYRDEICSLVSYNKEVADAGYTGGYGDPWQIVYVFDGDETTNVVCEGYGKAFQYLCDLTKFTMDIQCYTVVGTMDGSDGKGAHLWNIVTMEDGKNYMVDVTNSDEGTIGAKGGLFLAGASGSIDDGYRFIINGKNQISFFYDPNETVVLWGSDKGSILNLSETDYGTYEEVSTTYADIMTVKILKGTNAINLHVIPKNNDSLPELTLYTAVYDTNGMLIGMTKGSPEEAKRGITFSVDEPTVSNGETYQVLLWADGMVPVIEPIKS